MENSHKDSIATVNREIVSTRLDTLVNIFDAAFKDVSGICLNKHILLHVVECYFLDLTRMKAFHQIAHEDQHKRAAFTMFWIVKLRPVQIHPDYADMTKELLIANEQFALHAGLAHLKINISDISPTYLRNLIYTLHFRQPFPEILALTMYLLECACNGKKP